MEKHKRKCMPFQFSQCQQSPSLYANNTLEAYVQRERISTLKRGSSRLLL